MKKFLYRIFLMSVLFTISIVFITLFLLHSMQPDEKILEEEFLAANFDKIERLKRSEKPRIILIGGSNLAFGVCSPMMEDSLKMKVVNMGLHAGLGLRYMLEEISEYVTTEDIVVVIPEYAQFMPEGFYGGEALTRLLLLQNKPIRAFQHIRWEKDLPIICRRSIRTFMQTVNGNQELIDKYSRKKFNSHGDYIGHWNEKSQPIEKNVIDSRANPEVIQAIKNYFDLYRQKNIRVLLYPPSFCKSSYLLNQEWIKELVSSLEQNKIPFQASPQRYVFDASLFFDSEYHLTKEGGQKRTIKLIEDLRK